MAGAREWPVPGYAEPVAMVVVDAVDGDAERLVSDTPAALALSRHRPETVQQRSQRGRLGPHVHEHLLGHFGGLRRAQHHS